MGGLRYTGIEAAINGMAAFIIPQESEIQTNNFCSENHVHCVLDRKGVLLVDFLTRCDTINAAAYCATLHKLRRAIQNKRRGMLSACVVLLHDNARPHTANRTQDLITSFGWEQLDHPPYSPDLAPSNYHLFMHLKKHLAGQRHSDDNEAKTTVKQWLSNQVASFLDDGIQKLVPRYDKCLNSNVGIM
ncbi:mariner Mos1 transposase [Trichonephila clavipes]|nr:mariner Mos1 transposase [Trichonephila clavipes]